MDQSTNEQEEEQTVAEDVKEAFEQHMDGEDIEEDTPERNNVKVDDEDANNTTDQESDQDLADEGQDLSEQEVVQQDYIFPTALPNDVVESAKEAPREVQKWLIDYVNGQQAYFTQKSQELAQGQRALSSLESTITPHIQRIQLDGETLEGRLGELLAMDQMYAEDPESTILMLMENSGVNPQDLLYTGSQVLDPQIGQLRDELNDLRDEYSSYKENAEGQQVQQLSGTIDQIVNSVDASGQPLFPYWDMLQGHIEALTPQIRQSYPTATVEQVLTEAYNEALWQHPRTRQQMIDRQVQEKMTSSKADQKKRVQKAKKASSSIKGSHTAGRDEVEDDSIEAEIRRAMEHSSNI